MPITLVDASFLVALAYLKASDHDAVVQFAVQHRRDLLIPEAVLVEAMFNIKRLAGEATAVAVGRELLIHRQSPLFVSLTGEDFERALNVMEIYANIKLDFVDCCLTALAERLNITQIATLDRRDFSIIRPRHVSYFTLVP